MTDFIQNTYGQDIGKAYEGMLADNGGTDKYSYSAETDLRYGAGVELSTSGDPARQAAHFENNNILRGVVIREHVREGQLVPLAGDFGSGETSYVPATHTASVLLRGRIYVKVDEDVTAGDIAFCQASAGPRGAWARSTLTGYVAVARAMFVTTAASGDLAILELS